MSDEKEDKAGAEDQKPRVGNDEIFSVPAVFANKVYLTKSPLGARLTFVESFPGGESYRTAVYLNIMDVTSLRDLLQTQLADVQFSIEQVEDKG